jgi:hypothetical protein
MIGILDVDVHDGAVDVSAYRIEMAIDLGSISRFVRLQVIPEAQPACAE